MILYPLTSVSSDFSIDSETTSRSSWPNIRAAPSGLVLVVRDTNSATMQRIKKHTNSTFKAIFTIRSANGFFCPTSFSFVSIPYSLEVAVILIVKSAVRFIASFPTVSGMV